MFLKVSTDSISITKNLIGNSIITQWLWFYLSIAEFFVIIFLLYWMKKSNSKLAFSKLTYKDVKNARSESIDMNNLINSINGSRDLYKELSRKCHPDNFVDSPLQKNAEEIFQEISKNKRDFGKLLLLKARAETELKIIFKPS